MRKEYYSPEMEVICFTVSDVITTSGEGWALPDDNLTPPGEGNVGQDGW